MMVRQEIIDGWSVTDWAALIAARMASVSWPSISSTCQLDARNALDLVVRHREAGGAVDRDRVVVEEGDQLAELEVAGERDRLMADALHQAAIAHGRHRCNG